MNVWLVCLLDCVILSFSDFGAAVLARTLSKREIFFIDKSRKNTNECMHVCLFKIIVLFKV